MVKPLTKIYCLDGSEEDEESFWIVVLSNFAALSMPPYTQQTCMVDLWWWIKMFLYCIFSAVLLTDHESCPLVIQQQTIRTQDTKTHASICAGIKCSLADIYIAFPFLAFISLNKFLFPFGYHRFFFSFSQFILFWSLQRGRKQLEANVLYVCELSISFPVFI